MSSGIDLQAEAVSRLDLSDFFAVDGSHIVSYVLDIMRLQHLSAVLVLEGEALVGIFTERDVLLKIADKPETWGQPVRQFMTTSPQGLGPEDTILSALRLMNAGHFRNMPVCDKQGKPLGNLSQSSIIRFLTDRFPRDVYNLPPDPEAIPQSKEGA
jgi:CBS domain-containing protein